MSILDSLRHIASEGSLSVRCCAGSVEEFQEAEPALRSATAVVVDPSALATLFFSGQYEHLGAMSAKCVVCESALQEFRDLAQELASGPARFMGKHKGKYLWMDDDPTNRELQLEKVNRFLAGIQSIATVETGRALANMDPETKRKMINLFGQPTAESIAAARGEGMVLWSDDFAVGLAQREEFGGLRVWTQLVFQTLATDRKVPSETYMALVVFLLEWSYFFTRIYPETVLFACRAAGWDPKSPPLAKVLQWIGVPELNEEGATILCAAALPRIWRLAALFHQAENVTRALMESLLSRNNGRELVAAIRGTISRIFGIDVVNARSCAAAIEDVLEGRTPSGLIVPG
jgi:hypothetical protein